MVIRAPCRLGRWASHSVYPRTAGRRGWCGLYLTGGAQRLRAISLGLCEGGLYPEMGFHPARGLPPCGGFQGPRKAQGYLQG